MDETRAIGREEDDGFSDLVRRRWTSRGCLSGQSLEILAHRVSTFGASGSGAHCVHATYSAAQTFVSRLIAALLKP